MYETEAMSITRKEKWQTIRMTGYKNSTSFYKSGREITDNYFVISWLPILFCIIEFLRLNKKWTLKIMDILVWLFLYYFLVKDSHLSLMFLRFLGTMNTLTLAP